jgi:hypothetical protein
MHWRPVTSRLRIVGSQGLSVWRVELIPYPKRLKARLRNHLFLVDFHLVPCRIAFSLNSEGNFLLFGIVFPGPS